MKTYLAVDTGASGGRHIVGWVEHGKIETPEVYRFENGAEMKGDHLVWDIDAIVAHVIAGMKACREQGYTPVSMGIDTWGVDFALLDAQGQRIGDTVAYRDSRTQGMDRLAAISRQRVISSTAADVAPSEALHTVSMQGMARFFSNRRRRVAAAL